MRIGILGGTGPAGSALAARLASVGYDAVIGSRSKYRAMEACDSQVEKWPDLAGRLSYGDNAAAAACDLVVIATPWDSAATTAQENAEALAGKIVVSMANALVRVGKEFQPLVPPRGSVAAHVQAAVPLCRVVAAFHHLPATELGHIGEPIDSDVLICGDDAAAVKTMSEIISKIPGCRPLDAGELSNATAIEAFTAVMLQLNVRYKTRVAPKLTGIKGDPREAKAAAAAARAAAEQAAAQAAPKAIEGAAASTAEEVASPT
ncbi:MAG: NADPH-dependent F420 reductase [Actinomycetota bacterium]|nr:NADPH-dependent F420 reductase [Actinomycetota bacterium]